MGARGRERIHAGYENERVVDEWEALFRDLVNRKVPDHLLPNHRPPVTSGGDRAGPGRSPWWVAAGRAEVDGRAEAVEVGWCRHPCPPLVMGGRLWFRALRVGPRSRGLASSGARVLLLRADP